MKKQHQQTNYNLTEEQEYVLEELKAELAEQIWTSNCIEMEAKHSVGQELYAYPELVPYINNEAHYYVEFAKKYRTIEDAIDKLNLGKGASWYKIKKTLKTWNEKEKASPKKS